MQDSIFASDVALTEVLTLRLSVGCLGEQNAENWWPSRFLSPTSEAFLAPVFGSKVLQARYHGVLEAARRVHDDHIGIGRVFHPFRLPEVMEQRLSEAILSSGEELTQASASVDAARAALQLLAGKPTEPKSGPALLGTSDMLQESDWISEAASLYLAAFAAGVRCYPYYKSIR